MRAGYCAKARGQESINVCCGNWKETLQVDQRDRDIVGNKTGEVNSGRDYTRP